VKVTANFPEPCRFVLETLREVYAYDAVTREQGMSAEERLAFHQEHSKPVMDKLHIWLNAQFDEKMVEPNSGLGQAISYLLKHWEKLTLFLQVPGAPMDNNIVERALKKAILHRKNSLFFKNEPGAAVAEEPQSDQARARVGECPELAPQPLAPFGDRQAAFRPPGAAPEVLPVVEPGQVRPDVALIHSA
jgi:hypothetical protein